MSMYWARACSSTKLLSDDAAISQHVMQLCMVGHKSGCLCVLPSCKHSEKSHTMERLASSTICPAICSISGACTSFEHVILSKHSATV